MDTFYKPLVLNNANWESYRGKLTAFPLRVSKISKLESPISVKAISLKYVANGHEKYRLGNKQYHLFDNQFLLTNKFSNCEVSINETQSSTGICIDLDEQYFSDIIASIYQPNDIENLNQQTRFFLSDELYSQGNSTNGKLKLMLQHLVNAAETDNEIFSPDDFLKSIAYEVITSQQIIIKEFNKINVIKLSTKRELYARLCMARNIILDCAEKQFTIREIASQVCLSEFRLYHLFKQTFGITPHQLQTKTIMQKSVELHKNQHLSWTTIAFLSGYADIQTFSKVFKKIYGYSPSALR